MTLLLRIASIALFLVARMSFSAPAGQDGEKLVWPLAPVPPRVEFVRTFASAADLGIEKGFFAKLSDWLFGEAGTRLVRPMAVVENGGVIYVADTGAKGVHRFDPAGGDYTLVRGADGVLLPSPVGLARGAGGDVYVADSRLGQIFVIRPGAKFAAALRLDIKLTQPTGIAFEPATGHLFVADTAEHRIHVFERDGSLARTIGRRGTGDGEFNYPTYLWRTREGRLYVTDSLNFRIQAFDSNGRFVLGFGRQGDGTGDAARPKGVATDGYGHVYVVDALFHAFQIFDNTGRLLLPVGERGHERGEFWLPTGIFIDDNLIYIADSYNQRIQVLRYIGGAS